MIKKIFATYFSSFLIFYPVSFADEKVTTLNTGDPAPFNGTLFNTQAAARLLTDLEFTQESCQIETNRLLGIQESQLRLEIDNLSATIDSSRLRHESVLEIKNNQILFLDDQLKKANPNNKVLWFAVGVVGGVAITATAGWTMGQINP